MGVWTVMFCPKLLKAVVWYNHTSSWETLRPSDSKLWTTILRFQKKIWVKLQTPTQKNEQAWFKNGSSCIHGGKQKNSHGHFLEKNIKYF